MKISKIERHILICAIERLYLDKPIDLNEKGIKKLAQIQCKLVAEELNINAKDIFERTFNEMIRSRALGRL